MIREVFIRGWLPGLIAGRRRTRAITLIAPIFGWALIVYFNRKGEEPSLALRVHEHRHVWDWRDVGGWFYARTYLWDLLTKGYRGVRWEKRAYEEQAIVEAGQVGVTLRPYDRAREDSGTMGPQGGSRS